jgi:hypothetical protein
MNSILNFPASVEATAFRMGSEYAWQKKDLGPVFNYCAKALIAIAGGEAWVVRRLEDCQPDEPTEPIHNLDPHRSQKGSVMARTLGHVIYGIMPLRNGQSAVFSWDNRPREYDQPWQKHVSATIHETIDAIERGKLEADVVPEYAPYIYYNLIFEHEIDR